MENEVLDAEREPSQRALRSVERALEPRYEAYLDEVRRLLRAGVEEMAEGDTVDPRVADIVRRAGLSNKAFYRHFRSKDELLLAILEEGLKVTHEKLKSRMEGSAPLDRIRSWMREILVQALDPEMATTTRPLVLHQARLIESLGDELWGAVDQLKQLLREAIAEAAASGDLAGAEPETDAEAIYHLTVGWMNGRILDRSAPSAEEAERIVEFAMRGLERP